MRLSTGRRWRPVDNRIAPLPLAGRALPHFFDLDTSALSPLPRTPVNLLQLYAVSLFSGSLADSERIQRLLNRRLELREARCHLQRAGYGFDCCPLQLANLCAMPDNKVFEF
ncbi:hypothetical protein [Burkholderia lata]|uniref:hypothetical protein n=1 Tax=Burkholderia lata (strain ATCC 17760 / DSM 23089 / LMG 22485 / NCIMB 9086 / R18194 / 383) TaxID=482957 RepID=UPI00158327CF|nr:hypothetical protein [Burkholderia lata]